MPNFSKAYGFCSITKAIMVHQLKPQKACINGKFFLKTHIADWLFQSIFEFSWLNPRKIIWSNCSFPISTTLSSACNFIKKENLVFSCEFCKFPITPVLQYTSRRLLLHYPRNRSRNSRISRTPTPIKYWRSVFLSLALIFIWNIVNIVDSVSMKINLYYQIIK